MKKQLLACLIAIVYIALPACDFRSEKEKKEQADLDKAVRRQEINDSLNYLKEQAEKIKKDSIAEANSETGKLKKALRDKGGDLCAIYREIEDATANAREFADKEYGKYSTNPIKRQFIELSQHENFTKIMAKYGMGKDVALQITLIGMRECK